MYLGAVRLREHAVVVVAEDAARLQLLSQLRAILCLGTERGHAVLDCLVRDRSLCTLSIHYLLIIYDFDRSLILLLGYGVSLVTLSH